MPMYDYRCPNCETEFEKIVSKPDPDIPQECPKCGTLSTFTMPNRCRDKVLFLFNYFAPDA